VFTDPGTGRSEVCRFFGVLDEVHSTHFYTGGAGECAKVKTLLAWTYESIAFYSATPTKDGCGTNWPVYRSFYRDNISDFNHRFTVELTAHVRMAQRRGDVLEGVVMCAPVTDAEREADGVRLLEQATLAPMKPLISEVKAKGVVVWIDEQIQMNVMRYTQWPFFDDDAMPCMNDDTPPLTPEKYCPLNNLSPYPVGWEFFRQAKTAPDPFDSGWRMYGTISSLQGASGKAPFHMPSISNGCATAHSERSRTFWRSTRCRRF
jgi:hypothetical protein